MIKALALKKINIMVISTSEIKISVLVSAKHIKKAIAALHKEFRLDNKDTVHKRIEKITYKIGSGHHTNSHLYEINGYIHQIPYTYYTQENISDLPPGYENGGNTRFSREIALECMSCHNGHSNLVEGSNHKYHSIPQGIECESCHGPGEVHVKRKLAGELIDTSKYLLALKTIPSMISISNLCSSI